MKGIICYYSGTGNTKLACEYISKKMKNVKFDFFDIVKEGIPNLEKYDIVGFAAWADFLGPPQKIIDFLNSVEGNGKPAFVFNTFGNFNGSTLKKMAVHVKKQGFDLIAGYALHTPENVPSLILLGMTREDAPSPKELQEFNDFIQNFDKLIRDYKNGVNTKLPLINYIWKDFVPAFPRKTSALFTGQLKADSELCTKCGLCTKVCPYGAISMEGLPIFDKSKCYGCWACYNKCPTKAVHTKTYKGKGHYTKPHDKLVEKLKI